MQESYNTKTFWKCLFGIVLISAFMKITGGSGFIIVPMLAFWGVITGNTRTVMFSLMVANCALLGNAYFFPKGIVFNLAHRGMMVFLGVCVAAKVFGGRQYDIVTPFMWLIPFLIFMMLPSAFGWAPMVSFLKLFLFIVVYVAYAGVAKMAMSSSNNNIQHYRAMLLSVTAFFVIGSLVIMPFPSISFLNAADLASDSEFMAAISEGRVVSLYKGMAFHSQALGPLISVLCVFLVGDLLFNIQRPDKLYIVMIAICPYLIYKTSSRTAMAGLIGGVAIMWFLFRNSRQIHWTWRAKILRLANLIVLFMIITMATLSNVRGEIARFALKYSSTEQAEVSAENIMSSRQGLIEKALYNWSKKPLIGNGFQVSEAMASQKREGIKDYLTAPVEKGVWITAVLEEGGIVGLVLFCVFWISAVIALWSRNYYATASMLLSLIILNMAEFTIFSMSGIGGFIWAVVFVVAILDGAHKREEMEYYSPIV